MASLIATTSSPDGDTFALPEQGFAYGDRVLALQFHPEMTPEAVRAFAEGGADELVPGPWIQTREAMLADTSRFERLETLLAGVLEVFAGGARGGISGPLRR